MDLSSILETAFMRLCAKNGWNSQCCKHPLNYLKELILIDPSFMYPLNFLKLYFILLPGVKGI